MVVDVWAPVLGRIRRSFLRVKARWKIVCERHPQRGWFYGPLRLALLARANLREVTSRLKWWSLGWTAGVIQRPATVQSKLFAELTKTADRCYRPARFDIDIVVVRAREFGGWEWALRRTEPDLSWNRITHGRIDVVPVSGDHVSIIEDGGAAELADVLTDAVRARSMAPGPAVSPEDPGVLSNSEL